MAAPAARTGDPHRRGIWVPSLLPHTRCLRCVSQGHRRSAPGHGHTARTFQLQSIQQSRLSDGAPLELRVAHFSRPGPVLNDTGRATGSTNLPSTLGATTQCGTRGSTPRVMAGTTAPGAITQAPHSHRWGLSGLASGATASSEGAQPVCRLPLAAFRLSTSDFSSRRPAAVIQYDDQGSGAQPPSEPFIGASDDRGDIQRFFASVLVEHLPCSRRPPARRTHCLAERRAYSTNLTCDR